MMQRVYVKSADGREREVVLLSHTKTVAYVCPVKDYEAAVKGRDGDYAVGFPIEDVRAVETGQPLSKNNT